MTKKKGCPRCKSRRVSERLNGGLFCERCGQRWASHGLLIPSFDRRKLTEEKEVVEDKQLQLSVDVG